jgi:hypothetical protein
VSDGLSGLEKTGQARGDLKFQLFGVCLVLLSIWILYTALYSFVGITAMLFGKSNVMTPYWVKVWLLDILWASLSSYLFLTGWKICELDRDSFRRVIYLGIGWLIVYFLYLFLNELFYVRVYDARPESVMLSGKPWLRWLRHPLDRFLDNRILFIQAASFIIAIFVAGKHMSLHSGGKGTSDNSDVAGNSMNSFLLKISSWKLTMLIGVLVIMGIIICLPYTPLNRNDLTEEEKREFVDFRYVVKGSRLSPIKVKEYERRLLKDPDSFYLRSSLLGYYFGKQLTGAERRARKTHIIWLISKYPDGTLAGSPYAGALGSSEYDGLGEIEDLWRNKLRDKLNDTKIIKNFAQFEYFRNERMSEELLRKGISLQPRNSYWYSQLGMLLHYRIEKIYRSRKYISVEKDILETVDILSKAVKLNKRGDSFYELEELGDLYYWQGNNSKLEDVIRRLKRDSKNARLNYRGDAYQKACILSGKERMRSGDIKGAKDFLIKAVSTNMTTDSSPDLSLAQLFIDIGQKELVLSFLARAADLPSHEGYKEMIRKYIKDINAGIHVVMDETEAGYRDVFSREATQRHK